MGLEQRAAVLLLPAIGQAHVLSTLPGDGPPPDPRPPGAEAPPGAEDSTYSFDFEVACGEDATATSVALVKLVRVLEQAEQFYDSIGGVLGYQLRTLELVAGLGAGSEEGDVGSRAGPTETRLHRPAGPDLSDSCPEGPALRRRWAAEGLRAMPEMAEIYPVGGAGDRLGLVCERTGESLPTAVLPYCGRTLLEGLVRDLQAREYLYWKLFGEQVTTPLVVMTSRAKGNHRRITELLDGVGWMGRGKESYFLVEQPMVPVVSAEDGRWLVEEPLGPVLKPGGHGALWKLMRDEGAFEWLARRGRKAAVVRQISNPLAGTDATLLALAGAGRSGGKAFGFASCPRALGAAEGINVLVERRLADGACEYGVSNIEYTEFDRIGFSDAPDESGTSRYPANTNVLYVDLGAAVRALGSCADAALPGMIFNTKKRVAFRDATRGGEARSVRAGRIETTMQNLADHLTQRFPAPLGEEQVASGEGLSTFVVFNDRRRVTSSAKRQRKPGDKHLHQTPDGSFRDLAQNARELLTRAGWAVPEVGSEEDFLERGPGFVFLWHPALGPLWEVAAQKVRNGSLAEGSELVLEVAEALLDGVEVDGSLRVEAAAPMGRAGGDGRLAYGEDGGRVRLERCRVSNEGVDRGDPGNLFWRHRVSRVGGMLVRLEGRSEFEAADVEFRGSHAFVVPDGVRMRVSADPALPGGLRVETEPLGDAPSWRWECRMDEETGRIDVELV